ncbi:flagellar biosynthesis protein FlhF [Parahaliea aestuarii]|uniref:Flagellar biosynthesis protein FlhF n=1 Tax=Parahaliea aestuarii TaxID=1852021 RepID=A0A5C9A3Z9_9GAMM|nr:flagellar biosynthesis protein FlhF [Parahaliea aestuarii]TXS94809.1 flagellar biosynthesis protein FlhF [Parahaliea aestuarii]
MTVKRFVGTSSREAMRQVRAVLGEDALIIANRPTDAGIEILAMADGEAGGAETVSLAPKPRLQAVETSTAGAVDTASLLASHERLLNEVQAMREMLDAARPPQPVEVDTPDEAGEQQYKDLRSRLLGAGFGAGLAEDIAATAGPGLTPGAATDTWLVRQLQNRLRTPADAVAELEEGGLLALVGPTGVGKTTTAAKLAARYAMRYGSGDIALVSADHYRVGARDQLKVYADLLGVAMHVLAPGESLADLPQDIASKPLLIVDTAGMGQRDQRLREQMQQLAGGTRPVRAVLMVNASSQAETLDDTVVAYREAARSAGVEIVNAIVSKLDEAPRLGPALATIMRHNLCLHFVAYGQRVPEDLAPAAAGELMSEALMASASPEDEVAGARDPLDRGLALQSVWQQLSRELGELDSLQRVWGGEAAAALAEAPAATRFLVQGRDATEDFLALDRGGLALLSPVAAGPARQLPQRAEGCGLMLSKLPDSHSALMLLERQIPWLVAASHQSRVYCEGQRMPLSQLWSRAESAGAMAVNFRAREVQLRLHTVTVYAAPGGRRRRCSVRLRACLGELRNLDTGAVVGRRYWLAPAELHADDCRALLAQQMFAETFFALRRKASDLLGERLPTWRGQAARLHCVAHGLAALACRLDGDHSEWALDVRAQLLALDGRTRRRSPQLLLQALLQLFGQREALRRLALSLPAGNA